MSAGAGLLGPVWLSNTEGVTQGRYAGLQVELGGLRQERLLAKVVEVKQCGATLHLGLHQGRRSDLHPEKQTNSAKRACDVELTGLSGTETPCIFCQTQQVHVDQDWVLGLVK